MEILEGIKEKVIKESEDEFDINKIESLIKAGVDFPDPILTFDEQPFIFPYTVNLIQGTYGANKSYFASHLASAILNPERDPKLLGLSVDTSKDYFIAYLDTERSTRDQLPAAMGQIILNSGLNREQIPNNFKSASLKKYQRNDRLSKTKKFIESIRSNRKHVVLFIDVITDSMNSFNDLGETNTLLDELNRITENEDVTIIGIIHENPDGSKKARGHIGTEIVNKATTAVSIGYRDEGSNILSLKIIKNRLAKRQGVKYLKRCPSSGLLVFADSMEIEQIESKKKINLGELAELFIETLNNRELAAKELIEKMRNKFQASEKTNREAINNILDNQHFLRVNGFELKVRTGPYNAKLYSLGRLDEKLPLVE